MSQRTDYTTLVNEKQITIKVSEVTIPIPTYTKNSDFCA